MRRHLRRPPSQDTPAPAMIPGSQPQAEVPAATPLGAPAAAADTGAMDTREAPPRRAGTPVLIARPRCWHCS